MLVLTRKIDQTIEIGPDVIVTVVKIQGDSIRIGVTAPRNVKVHRGEVAQKIRDGEHPNDAA